MYDSNMFEDQNHYVSHQDIGRCFFRMKHLTELRTCIATLGSISLPSNASSSIERLDVAVHLGNGTGSNQLPDALFSSLKHFGAFNYYDGLTSILPSFVTQLTSLQLHLNYYQNDIQEVLSKVA
ncbi:hypothetical protein FRC09_004270, partial [Ceratobasidium sp. 395]